MAMDRVTETKAAADKGTERRGLVEGIDEAVERRARRRVIAELADEVAEPGEEEQRSERFIRRLVRRRILNELLGEAEEPEERMVRRLVRRRILAEMFESDPIERLMLRREVAQAARAAFTPKADIFEQDGTLVIRAELPGMKKGDVDISIDEGDLVIRGELKADATIRDEDVYQDETIHGKFYRRVPLPEGAKIDQIKADYRDGVLEVRVPMPARPKVALA